MVDMKKLGYVRVGTAVPEVSIANPQANIEEIIRRYPDIRVIGNGLP